MPPTAHLENLSGVDSPITKISRGSQPPLGMQFSIIIHQKMHKIKLHLGYKSCVSFTKLASRLQKWHFVYKYSVVGYKHCISVYKVASRLSID
jgi:hypothetical protein